MLRSHALSATHVARPAERESPVAWVKELPITGDTVAPPKWRLELTVQLASRPLSEYYFLLTS
jgi:hypothetical protein